MGRLSRRPQQAPEPIGLGDRLAMALFGAVVAALTLGGYLLALLLISPRGLSFAWLVFSPAGLAFVALGALIGGCSRPPTLAAYFGFLWGQHPAWNTRFVRVFAGCLLAALLLFALLLRWRYGR